VREKEAKARLLSELGQVTTTWSLEVFQRTPYPGGKKKESEGDQESLTLSSESEIKEKIK